MPMFPGTLLATLYQLLAVAFSYTYPTHADRCYCSLTEDTSDNRTVFTRKLIRCQRSNLTEVSNPRLPCHRLHNLVRIGPMLFSDAANETNDVDLKTNITVAPWGFSDLFASGLTTSLQLDLELANAELNALSMGGLDTLKAFLGRHSFVRWDGCSFANMRQLEHVLLSCKSGYRNFLTFGPSIRLVRFVDCEEAAMQFYCVTCQQNPDFSVIRISPGPPLGQYMVKFFQFGGLSNGNLTDNYGESHFYVGKCVPSICSDEVLCRGNQPLKTVMDNIRNEEKTEKAVGSELDGVQTEVLTEDSDTSKTQMNWIESPINGQTLKNRSTTVLSHKLMLLTHRQHIWITAAVICLVLVFVVTLGVLIGMTRKGSRRRHWKTSRHPPRRQRNAHSNGLPSVSLVNGIDEETKMEPRLKSSSVQDIQTRVNSGSFDTYSN